MKREIVRCKCGKKWFVDRVYAYSYRVFYGRGFPPEGFTTETEYYCEDCIPF